ncbi:MAG TPA: CDF family Co(II)/Ni(II) efflux transporter DmeF [Burkholderiaceae bacterium]|nr:CDF family Co(II)/Ni(II) efflux transporter DmeF [Burkholderiaceae bacterium]
MSSPIGGAGHSHDLRPFRHSHAFADDGMRRREHAMAQVTVITLVVMALELGVGWWSGSLALTADGWHMGTHALALGGAVLAYRLSARAGGHAGYAFGGWKIEVLTAYTSGLALLGAAAWIGIDAVQALRRPQPIAYHEAITIAIFGLVVNLACAWLLGRSGGHARHDGPAGHAPAHHDGGHAHAHHHHAHHDHNFKAAYVHVLADAFTSVLAIVALAGGLFIGWAWLDPVVALFGAAVIGQWSFSVLGTSAKALVDATADPAIAQRVRDLVEADGDAKVADLHVWQVGASAWSAAVSIVADRPLPAADYRQRLAAIEPLRHVTVEVHRCPGESRP